jgi:hypothetical protein
VSKVSKPLADSLLDCVERGKNSVAEPVLLKMIPEMFGGIEFGTVGRKPDEADVVRDAQIGGAVPPGLVENHKTNVIGIHGGGVGEKNRHRFAVATGKHQR